MASRELILWGLPYDIGVNILQFLNYSVVKTACSYVHLLATRPTYKSLISRIRIPLTSNVSICARYVHCVHKKNKARELLAQFYLGLMKFYKIWRTYS